VPAHVVPNLAPGEPLGLPLERLVERQVLEAARSFVLMVRVGPLDRVAKESDQLDIRERLGDAVGGVRVSEVVGAPLTGHRVHPAGRPHVPLVRREREVRAVLLEIRRVVRVEEMSALAQKRPHHGGVLHEVLEERGRPGTLGADDEVVG
jgi:hypothetical protein